MILVRVAQGLGRSQLAGAVFFFFFLGTALLFSSLVLRVCFCPTAGAGAVCAGRVVIAGELSGGVVTVGIVR